MLEALPPGSANACAEPAEFTELSIDISSGTAGFLTQKVELTELKANVLHP